GAVPAAGSAHSGANSPTTHEAARASREMRLDRKAKLTRPAPTRSNRSVHDLHSVDTLLTGVRSYCARVRRACLRSLVDDRQIALDALDADHERIGIAWLARRNRRQLRLGTIEDRVVRDEHV